MNQPVNGIYFFAPFTAFIRIVSFSLLMEHTSSFAEKLKKTLYDIVNSSLQPIVQVILRDPTGQIN
jgi:hypothetical protein